jgi:hypothetical protein
MRMRNSPTNPLSPGTRDRREHDHVNTAAKIGATFCSPLSAEISRVCRRSTMKPTRRNSAPVLDAVVDHLQHATGHRLAREREGAEDDEPEVGDGRSRR